jgi:type 1 fimbria pilin
MAVCRNRTTRPPIQFETLERGPDTLTTNGTYNYPFLVQYFKTAAVMTPGAVRGRVVVNVEMQ